MSDQENLKLHTDISVALQGGSPKIEFRSKSLKLPLQDYNLRTFISIQCNKSVKEDSPMSTEPSTNPQVKRSPSKLWSSTTSILNNSSASTWRLACNSRLCTPILHNSTKWWELPIKFTWLWSIVLEDSFLTKLLKMDHFLKKTLLRCFNRYWMLCSTLKHWASVTGTSNLKTSSLTRRVMSNSLTLDLDAAKMVMRTPSGELSAELLHIPLLKSFSDNTMTLNSWMFGDLALLYTLCWPDNFLFLAKTNKNKDMLFSTTDGLQNSISPKESPDS